MLFSFTADSRSKRVSHWAISRSSMPPDMSGAEQKRCSVPKQSLAKHRTYFPSSAPSQEMVIQPAIGRLNSSCDPAEICGQKRSRARRSNGWQSTRTQRHNVSAGRQTKVEHLPPVHQYQPGSIRADQFLVRKRVRANPAICFVRSSVMNRTVLLGASYANPQDRQRHDYQHH